ncbi:helix-turn-helix transcriptional regulator [Streptomyces iconiensis]|uniref:Helix-turn-helix transcriptional regulator n=1 Tax=Streptomyces iconiensis TaxID=1384038 RepID=A0ABT6ZQA2_9ACTN|nr:helix-turn-helix transcriptional regulator [Streptomyces iconiensis]MDJ1131240.1 helix-turn-helix transcriptional regulator [Streptomyces iconiensis]
MHQPADPEPPDWLRQQRLDIGRRVRDARLWANLTQEGLAEAIGAERRTVVRIELGITSPPLDRLLYIARALGIPPADLMPDA